MPTPDLHSQEELSGSATAALRSAARVFVVTIGCSPIRWIVTRVFDEEAVFEWKFALVLSSLLSLAWFFAVFLTTYFDLRKLDRIDRDTNPRFPGTSFLRGLYGGMIVFSVVMGLGLHQEGAGAEEFCRFLSERTGRPVY